MGSESVTFTTESFFDGRTLRGPSRVVIEDGLVVSIDDLPGRADHHLISPGFVDLQVNGWADVDFSTGAPDEIVKIDHELGVLGTTSYLATLVTDSLERLTERVDLLTSMMPTLRGMAGIHLEGPFLGGAPGAHRPDRITAIDLDWLEVLPASVRLVTIGAEQHEFARAATILGSRGIVVSIGHSVPTEPEYETAVASGARMCTHLFNAMSGVHHRDFGLALAALTDERISIGLIADMHHVSPRAVDLAFRARRDGIILVSDSVGWAAPWATSRRVEIRDGAPRLPDGTLAGSSTNLGECVRLAVKRGGAPLEAALIAATAGPSEVIGESESATIRVGSPADIVALNKDLRVVGTWRRLVSSRGNPTDD